MTNLVICGYSGAGKDTISKILTENFRYNRVVPYTTRPKRENEIDGKDYIFVTDEQFDNLNDCGVFFSTAKFNNWQYAIPYSGLNKNNWVIVANDVDYENLYIHKEYEKDIDFISIFIDADESIRVSRQKSRGDDINEINNRIVRDNDKWDRMMVHCPFDIIVENNNDVWDTVYNILVEVTKIN